MHELSTPRFRRPSEDHQRPLILGQRNLGSQFAEAYRRLRVNIDLHSADRPVKSIAVTSASSAEGRTTTVLNLAIVTAQAGRRVVVVDADLRRPDIDHMTASLTRQAAAPRALGGLSAALAGSARTLETLRPTSFDRLWVVPAGRIVEDPGEVMGSHRMRCVLEELSEFADQIILDTPPCVTYVDALLAARMVDGVVHVIRVGLQNKGAQQHVQKQLRQAKARVLGVVFNDIAQGDMTAYGYQGLDGRTGRS